MMIEKNEDSVLYEEARLFADYLLGRPPDAQIVDLYVAAMNKLAIVPRGKDQRLLRVALAYPRCLVLADAGSALLLPDSAFRSKLLVMFAIVECSPIHCELFLPRARHPLYALRVLWSAFRAGIVAILGALLVVAI